MTAEQPCTSTEARQFDFWVGVWDLTWPAEQIGGEPGDTSEGTNRIDKLFGQCAIEENFSTADGGFLGRSLSVYDTQLGIWRQTWVDSTGGYLLVTGEFGGGRMELRTEPLAREDETVIQRMVFRDIEHDSMKWDWQGSRDGGGTWNDLWNISYQRRS